MKKKLTAIALVAILVVIGIVGATMAYFTDTKTATNTFTFGNDLKIHIDETSEADPDKNIYAGTEKEDKSGYEFENIMPGKVYSKEPVIVVEAGSPACYVVATVEISDAELLHTIFKGTDVEKSWGLSLAGKGQLVEGGISGWTPTDAVQEIGTYGNISGTMLTSENGDRVFLTYSESKTDDTITYTFFFPAATPGETKTSVPALFETVKIPEGLTLDMINGDDGIRTNPDCDITVTAYAIQKEGFDSVYDAMSTAFDDVLAGLFAK